ncbi:MAG: DUF362 domain-containing protein [Bacteroidales bacterium]|nr:DUF362 domain-containing protein [Bacteroidales bacterium]
MKRRDFLKKGINAGIIAGTTMSIGSYGKIFGSPVVNPEGPYDMVAIKGGEPDFMFDRAIESLGGMKEYVKQGQSVVVKPNIGWDAVPERAANTNPKLVARIIEHCFDAGAKDVFVFDNTCDEWTKTYQNSGIEKAVKDAGGKIVPGNSEKYYREIEIPDGKKLKNAKVHELILDSDVFINVPVLKSHSSTRLTIAMKNLMGIVWDRMFWHRNDLHQCIADCASICKPDLNIVDAYNVMMENGPRGVSIDDVVAMKQQLISTDIVAIDAAATKLVDLEPNEINYIVFADEMGIGNRNLKELSINRIIV